MKTIVSASVLGADLLCFGKIPAQLEACGIEMLHYDVMDGVFVKSITYGAQILSAMNAVSDIFMDVHLMTVNPINLIDDFADAGADMITFHVESESNPAETVRKIKSRGLRAGVSVKPATPPEALLPFLNTADMLLIMTVEPGKGGQSFMADMLPKIRFLREKGFTGDIQVDGGITDKTAPRCVEAGANTLVAGTYLFRADDMKKAADLLR